MLMRNHNDNHIHRIQKAVEIMVLVGDKVLAYKRIIYLNHSSGQTVLHALKHLERRAFPGIVHIFLVSQTV